PPHVAHGDDEGDAVVDRVGDALGGGGAAPDRLGEQGSEALLLARDGGAGQVLPVVEVPEERTGRDAGLLGDGIERRSQVATVEVAEEGVEHGLAVALASGGAAIDLRFGDCHPATVTIDSVADNTYARPTEHGGDP